MTDDVLAEIISMPGNDACVDCGARGPRWASVSYGVVMCIQCSGKHRAMGVHLSKVRSLNLDRWDEAMVGAMRCGSNARLASFFASKEEASEGTERYYSRAAAVPNADREPCGGRDAPRGASRRHCSPSRCDARGARSGKARRRQEASLGS